MDQLYREEILRARTQTPQARVAGAFGIAPFARAIMEAGIRSQHPDADDAEVLRLGRERIAKDRLPIQRERRPVHFILPADARGELARRRESIRPAARQIVPHQEKLRGEGRRIFRGHRDSPTRQKPGECAG